MKSPRQLRLENEYKSIRNRLDGSPFIEVQPAGPAPFERYRVVYRVPSLRLDAQNRPVEAPITVVDFELPLSYPKDKPRAVVAGAAVFHPNFGDYICIADFWSPAQSLLDIIIEVGEMLQWQKYNILSPLNAVAANWAAANRETLPLAGSVSLASRTVLPAVRIATQGE